MRSKDGPPLLAARQHGVVTRAQLLALGRSPSAVDRAVAAGRLHRLHRGVYALGHPALSRHGRWMAAVLACGDGAALSHLSAAHLHGLVDHSPSPAHVTTPRTRKDVRGVATHRTRCLHDNEVTRKNGIPVTSVQRTLTDLADMAPARVMRRALHQAEVLYGVTPSPINGRRGTRRLREEPDRSRSELERAFARVMEQAGIERPAQNARVYGMEVDFVWAGRRLIVELDGWRYHRSRQAFERDRERDQALTGAGWRVLRFTHRQVTAHPGHVARTVGAALACRG
jgi:very-short-patch-repair endonuclease